MSYEDLDPHEQKRTWQGYTGTPSEEALRAMSYAELCHRLVRAGANTKLGLVIEAEKSRRDALDSRPNPNNEPASKDAKNHWQENIPIYLAVGVAIVVLGSLAWYLIQKHILPP